MKLDRIREWLHDPVAWFEEQYYIVDPETGRPTLIRLADHQKLILREIFTPDEDGLLPTEIVYSTIKKSGKTAIGGGLGEYVACAHSSAGTEVICAANDLEQAQGRVFSDLKYSVESNPDMQAKVEAKSIELKTGVTIKAVSSDYSSEAGSRHSAAVFDELWAYTSEKSKRLYEELTAIPTIPVSMRIVVSYAGFDLEGDLMKALVTRGMQGRRVFGGLPVWRNGRLLVYYDTGVEARRMPWQVGVAGAAYYADQQASLRPHQFLRLHENRFTSNEDRFVTAEMYDPCVDQRHVPLAPTKAVRISAAVDIGPKHDSSAVAATYRTAKGAVALALARKWQPEKGQTFIDDVEAFVLQLHRLYRLRTVRYDPYQFMAAAERLRRQGVPMEEWPQTTDRLTTMGQNLYDLIKGRKILFYPDKDLRQHTLNAIAVETPRGWRIAKEKSSAKVDLCVALAMAALDSSTPASAMPDLSQLRVVRAPLRPHLQW